MIEQDSLIERLEEIREEKMFSLYDFAKELGVSYLTYKKMIDARKNGLSPTISYVTKRKLYNYIEEFEEDN